MNVEVAVENLREVKDVLNKNGVEFWLDSGTLLGAVRDGKIIEWDNDIDLGTWYNNVTRIISIFPKFKKKGFSLRFSRKWGTMTTWRGKHNAITISLYKERSDCAWMIWKVKYSSLMILVKALYRSVDMSNIRVYAKDTLTNKYFLSLLPSTLKQLIADIAWAQLNKLGYNFLIVVPKHFFEELEHLEFYGTEFNVPSDVENYLAYRYGNWKVPVRNWVYHRDDGASTISKNKRRL
jgi:phosphorylcholine metabolism protein LicD